MRVVRASRRELATVTVAFALLLTGCGQATVIEDPEPTPVSTDFPGDEPAQVTPLTPVLETDSDPTTETQDQPVEPEPETEPPGQRVPEPDPSVEPEEESESPPAPEPEPTPPPVEEDDPVVEPPEPDLPRNYRVALTFDDGPGPWTDDILEVLLEAGVPATFFALGSEVNKYPGTAALLVNSGMDLQSHTYSHPRLTDLSDSQIRDQIHSTTEAFVNAGLEEPECARPPYGAHDARTDALFSESGETVVTWNVDPRDWSKPGSQAIADSVYEQVTERSKKNKSSVVLLHDGGGDRSQTLAALPTILKKLQDEGYEFFLVCGGS